MKVAMWASSGDRCGIAVYTRALTWELERLGVEVSLVPVPYDDRSPETLARTSAALNAADLVHLQHEYSFFGGIAPGASSLPTYYRALRRPLVITAHTVNTAAEQLRLAEEARWRQRLAKQALSSLPSFRATVERAPFAPAKELIVHTASARERFLRRGFRPERVHVLPAGTPPRSDIGGDPESVSAFRERFGLHGRKVATIFGFVSQDKGYEVALEALSSLPPAVKLLIAGGARVEREEPYVEGLTAEIRRRGLGDRVAITGYLEEPDVAAAMAASDVVLVPHRAANGSYSVMVALAYGKPVLASDLPCFRDIAEADGGVELFDVGDETALAERLGFLLASQNRRRELAVAAESYAAGRSWSAVAERTLGLYRSAMGGGSA